MRTQHQQINPATDEIAVDNGLAYLKYQEALIFVTHAAVFNALTVLTMVAAIPHGLAFDDASTDCWIPNVNGRPVKLNLGFAQRGLRDLAYETYVKACEIYEKETKKVQTQVLEVYATEILSEEDNEYAADLESTKTA